MARKSRQIKTLKPLWHFFCEGKSEVEYVQVLKSILNSKVKFKTYQLGDRITIQKIKDRMNDSEIGKNDKTILIYDMDVLETLNKLLEIKKQIKIQSLFSNPCLELWYLLHIQDYHRSSNQHEVEKLLKQSNPIWKNYKKALLNNFQKDFLVENYKIAIERAKGLTDPKNPSSSIGHFIENESLK